MTGRARRAGAGPQGPGGVRVGGQALSPKATGASSAVFYLATNDVDALVARTVAAGAQLTRAAADWFTGERDAQITDPFGHRWGLTQHIRDVPRDEIERAAIEAFSGAES